jgi:hypothetical protein
MLSVLYTSNFSNECKMGCILKYFSWCCINLYSLGERQVVNLVKIAAFCKDTNLVESQQAELKRQCLSYWEVPDKARTAPPKVAPEVKCNDILKKTKVGSSGGETQACLQKPWHRKLLWNCFALICSTDNYNVLLSTYCVLLEWTLRSDCRLNSTYTRFCFILNTLRTVF